MFQQKPGGSDGVEREGRASVSNSRESREASVLTAGLGHLVRKTGLVRNDISEGSKSPDPRRPYGALTS